MKLCVNQSPDAIGQNIIEGVIPTLVYRLVKARETGASFRLVFEMSPDDVFRDWVEVYGQIATPTPAMIERIDI